MGLNESDVSRLLAGEEPGDDPELREVAALLSDLREAYPPAAVVGVRDRHLEAVVAEARQLAATRPSRRSRRARRAVVTLVAGSLGVLTAGVGVAAATGGNPLALLPGLPWTMPAQSSSPSPSGPGSTGATADAGPRTPQPGPSAARPDRAASTASPAPAHKASDGASNNGKSGKPKTNQGKSAQAKADQDSRTRSNNGKSDQAKAGQEKKAKPDPPAKGKSKTGSTNSARAGT